MNDVILVEHVCMSDPLQVKNKPCVPLGSAFAFILNSAPPLTIRVIANKLNLFSSLER
jgi:hypothetical protein